MSRIDWPAKLAVACQPHQPGEAIGPLGVDYLRRDDTLVWRRFSRASVIHRPLLLLPGLSVAVYYVIQDHPACIPRGQRRPLRPELPAAWGVTWRPRLRRVWSSHARQNQVDGYAVGPAPGTRGRRACWRWSCRWRSSN